MQLSYVENKKYFLSMDMWTHGDCIIVLRLKIDENHGKRIFEHVCHERTKNEDFDIYYEIENELKNNTENFLRKYNIKNV